MKKIKIIDGKEVPHPEDLAMLQALYSRSPASVDDHLEKVASSGSGNFMDKYYVGYGHKSIGDCGTTTIFIEGVTMLTAKAIQDWPLYSGQEASTRYMDFSIAEFNDPLGTEESGRILERWRDFYLKLKEPVKERIINRYPIQDGESESSYERAVNARCFDILRSFLPAGAKTNLSWHTNLRQAADQLSWLVNHPDPSVALVARDIWKCLNQRYKNSFKKEDSEIAEYKGHVMANNHFVEKAQGQIFEHPVCLFDIDIKGIIIDQLIDLLKHRPKKAPVPRLFDQYGQIRSYFLLDFGSYRDLQRHRNGIIRMPLLTTDHWFNPWYLEQIPDRLKSIAVGFLHGQKESISKLDCPAFIKQNYIAMGFQVPCIVTQTLPAFIYRLELRSSKTVHPSLRRVIQAEISQFEAFMPEAKLYVDRDPDSWTVRRGNQTIKEK